MAGTSNTVIVDIDSTLYCFLSAFQKSASSQLGIDVPDPEHITEWSGIEPFFGDFRDFLSCVEHAYSYEHIDSNVPYLGAVSGVHRIQDAGYEIHYYTDRPKSMEAATFDWLEKYGFPSTSNLHVCADKRAELVEISEDIVTILDDRPRTLVWARYELGLEKVFSIKHGYNRNLVDIPGVFLEDNWHELVDTFFKEIGNGERHGSQKGSVHGGTGVGQIDRVPSISD